MRVDQVADRCGRKRADGGLHPGTGDGAVHQQGTIGIIEQDDVPSCPCDQAQVAAKALRRYRIGRCSPANPVDRALGLHRHSALRVWGDGFPPPRPEQLIH
jgi:hypothetical protein